MKRIGLAMDGDYWNYPSMSHSVCRVGFWVPMTPTMAWTLGGRCSLLCPHLVGKGRGSNDKRMLLGEDRHMRGFRCFTVSLHYVRLTLIWQLPSFGLGVVFVGLGLFVCCVCFVWRVLQLPVLTIFVDPRIDDRQCFHARSAQR